VLTLALAIGANAIVFSVLNALVAASAQCAAPRETCSWWSGTTGQKTAPSQSYPDYRDLRDMNRSFDSLVTYDIMGGVGLDTGSGNPAVVWPYMVSGNYFDALGIQPYLGRFIHASEEHGKKQRGRRSFLSYALWHSRFKRRPPPRWAAPVEINKHSYTIVGVAPREFRGTELFFAPDLWAPIVDKPQIAGGDQIEERGKPW